MKSKASGWVLTIARTLDSLGIDHKPLFKKVGMDPEALKSRNSRFSEQSVRRLWQLAVLETKGMNFGLKVAEQIRPSTFDVVGYSMTCSATLREAMHRFARFEKLISNSATVKVTETPDTLKVSFDFNMGGGTQPVWQAVDTSLAGLVHFSSWIAGENITPITVSLRHNRPQDLSEYRKFFACPIHFSCSENSVVFRADDMDRPILSADEELASLLDTVAISNMAEVNERFAKRVRHCLEVQVAGGEISRCRTAQLMNMTERTLLRRLKDEGTTFQEVLDKFREELAYDYLLRSDMTIQEVSALLGFSEASTFSRAFKRWTGHSPSMNLHSQANSAARTVSGNKGTTH